MAFKSLKLYNEERFSNLFLLRDDGDYADVVFLYQSVDDAMVVDTHYIKSAEYSGYVQCCGRNCPACAKGIKVQSKLFIPLYNIFENKVEIWDRGIRFSNQFLRDVFNHYPNPSEFVFRITRHGVAGSMDTQYSIMNVGRNAGYSYDSIIEAHNVKFPDIYYEICKNYSVADLSSMLFASQRNFSQKNSDYSLPNYMITPRGAGSNGHNNFVSSLNSSGNALNQNDKLPVYTMDNSSTGTYENLDATKRNDTIPNVESYNGNNINIPNYDIPSDVLDDSDDQDEDIPF